MYKYKIIKSFYWVIILLTGMCGCQKIIHGYLSDDVFYQVNPFTVQQGITTTSSSLVLNGSTAPLNVTLLSLVNASTGKSVDSMFLTPDTIKTYLDAVTYQDSTLAMLNAKLKDSAVAPFSIANIGGRLQFTSATNYVDTGTYSLSIKVSNARGERILSNACTIVLTPMSTIDSILYRAWTTSDVAGNFQSLSSGLSMDIKRDVSGPNKIVFKFLDKNGTPFSPANGEVAHRSGRPSFADWDPYYPEVATDSSFEYKYPSMVPEFPVFNTTVIAGGSSWSGGICYYQVLSKYTDIGLNVNPVSTPIFYATSGTYTVTYYLTNVVRK